jgi:hypothetical protein
MKQGKVNTVSQKERTFHNRREKENEGRIITVLSCLPSAGGFGVSKSNTSCGLISQLRSMSVGRTFCGRATMKVVRALSSCLGVGKTSGHGRGPWPCGKSGTFVASFCQVSWRWGGCYGLTSTYRASHTSWFWNPSTLLLLICTHSHLQTRLY